MNLFRPSTSRYNIENTDDGVKVVIRGRRNVGAILFLALGNFMWIYLISGLSLVWWGMLLAATGIMDLQYRGAPLYVMTLCVLSVFMLLLIFFGALFVYRFLWESMGEEIIHLSHNTLILTRRIPGWKKVHEFPMAVLNELKIQNTKRSLFRLPFQKHYLYAFEIPHAEKLVRFGYLVKENEAREIFSALKE